MSAGRRKEGGSAHFSYSPLWISRARRAACSSSWDWEAVLGGALEKGWEVDMGVEEQEAPRTWRSQFLSTIRLLDAKGCSQSGLP